MLWRARMRWTLALVVLAGCTEGDPGPRPKQGGGPDWAPVVLDDELGTAMADALAPVADVERSVRTLAHRIRQPADAELHAAATVESCQAVQEALWTGCAAFTGRPCWANATFYWAHDIPRCSGRVVVDETYADTVFSQVYVVDFAGASRVNPAPACGDGDLDDGEGCDDGNLAAFDGCDPNCQVEPFEGCETVIQQEFSAADVAWIDATTWQSPRSHLMIHNDAQPFGPVDGALCERAAAAATTVCTRLADEMPFVSTCASEVHLTADDACDVRLTVRFSRPSPDDGVFTTSLEGILAFTL